MALRHVRGQLGSHNERVPSVPAEWGEYTWNDIYIYVSIYIYIYHYYIHGMIYTIISMMLS